MPRTNRKKTSTPVSDSTTGIGQNRARSRRKVNAKIDTSNNNNENTNSNDRIEAPRFSMNFDDNSDGKNENDEVTVITSNENVTNDGSYSPEKLKNVYTKWNATGEVGALKIDKLREN